MTPLVIRLVGPAQCGKTTLATRTAAALADLRIGVVEANPSGHDDVEGVVHHPSAHWRKGFRQAIERMTDADIVIVEDRDQTPAASIGIGEDVQAIVVAADALDKVAVSTLTDAQVAVITCADRVPGYDEAAERERLQATNSHLAVITVGLADDDPGLRTWLDWLEARLAQHRA